MARLRLRSFIFKWKWRILCTCGVVLLVCGTAGWLAYQHVPTWYRPFWLPKADIHSVRARADSAFAFITEKMVDGRPFSISFSNEQLNELLVARQWLFPGTDRWLGDTLRTPYVHLEPETLRFGVRHHWGNVQSVLNLGVKAHVVGGRITLRLDGLQAGSLPIPRRLIANALAEVTADHADTARLRDVLEELVLSSRPTEVPNRFRWPNGSVPFRIDALALEAGKLTVRVVPG